VIGTVLGIATALRFGIGLAGAELSDRIGRRIVLVSGLALMTVAGVVFPQGVPPHIVGGAPRGGALGRSGTNQPRALLSVD
jgi:hypothetical protein